MEIDVLIADVWLILWRSFAFVFSNMYECWLDWMVVCAVRQCRQTVGRVREFVLDRAIASNTETIVAIIIIMRSANP